VAEQIRARVTCGKHGKIWRSRNELKTVAENDFVVAATGADAGADRGSDGIARERGRGPGLAFSGNHRRVDEPGVDDLVVAVSGANADQCVQCSCSRILDQFPLVARRNRPRQSAKARAKLRC
jgi:hypothetical protein